MYVFAANKRINELVPPKFAVFWKSVHIHQFNASLATIP